MTSLIKVIGFDLDDTLYDRDQVYEKTFCIMENKIIPTGVDFPIFNKRFQINSLREYDIFIKGHKKKAEYKIDRVIDTYNEFGITIDKDTAFVFDSVSKNLMNYLELRPGYIELLNTIQAKGIPIFVFSNGPYFDQMNKIKALKLENWVPSERIFISEAMGKSKPSNEAFEYVAKSLGVRPNEIFYVGDNIDNDIKAGIKNGWDCLFYNYTKINAYYCFPKVDSVAEMTNYIKKRVAAI